MKRSFSVLSAFLLAASVHAEVIDIDAGKLAALMSSGVAVVDIRTAQEWEETGVLPGSYLLTYFNEDGESDPQAFIASLASIAAADQPVVLVCRSGRRTEVASAALVSEGGYRTVYNVEDGLKGWVEQGGELTSAR